MTPHHFTIHREWDGALRLEGWASDGAHVCMLSLSPDAALDLLAVVAAGLKDTYHPNNPTR